MSPKRKGLLVERKLSPRDSPGSRTNAPPQLNVRMLTRSAPSVGLKRDSGIQMLLSCTHGCPINCSLGSSTNFSTRSPATPALSMAQENTPWKGGAKEMIA